MIFDCGRRLRRIEDKLDKALQMLRLSEKR